MTTIRREGPAVNEANPAGVWDRQTICNERTRSPRSARLLPEIPLEDFCPIHLMTDGDCTVACLQACRDLAVLIADYEIFWRWEYGRSA